MENDQNNKVRQLCVAGLFAALILVSILLIKLPVPGTSEYIHPGDGVLYLACAVLPMPYAILAAAVGAALADLFAGYAIWAPFSLIIKALMAFCVSLLCRGPQSDRAKEAPAVLIAGVLNTALYFGASVILYGLGAALVGIPFNLIQSVLGGAIFLALSKPVRHILFSYLKK